MFDKFKKKLFILLFGLSLLVACVGNRGAGVYRHIITVADTNGAHSICVAANFQADPGPDYEKGGCP